MAGQALGTLRPSHFGLGQQTPAQLLLGSPAWEGATSETAARLVLPCKPMLGTCLLSRPASVWTN